ncbi:hypothetical protein ACFOG5_21300 [Pedobacter fastidiosus]|uniref:hypothetical protein n=1 Tax=Pedobacter fastidiosus TaxID=2765361 RepID=UPI0036209304
MMQPRDLINPSLLKFEKQALVFIGFDSPVICFTYPKKPVKQASIPKKNKDRCLNRVSCSLLPGLFYFGLPCYPKPDRSDSPEFFMRALANGGALLAIEC